MSAVKIETLEEMAAAGLTLDQAIKILRVQCGRSSSAARQARYRERKAARNVTNDATRDVTGYVTKGEERKVSGPSKETHQNIPPSTPKGVSSPKSFDEFWLAYPRKVGKGAARKAYIRALAKIGDGGSQRLLEALSVDKRDWRDRGEPDFIPHAATWLNQERWSDHDGEPPPTDVFQPPTPERQARVAAYHQALLERDARNAQAN